jgi:hypothetical protein
MTLQLIFLLPFVIALISTIAILITLIPLVVFKVALFILLMPFLTAPP